MTEKLTIIDQVKMAIREAAQKATPDDHELVDTIIARAKLGHKESDKYLLTPAACALLFLNHNPHNRDWSPNTSLELARRMKDGEWKWNSQSISFYADGNLSDGQHRLGAAALSEYLFETSVGFGVEDGAIITVDAGKRRDAADAAKLDGMTNAKCKQAIIRNWAQYMQRATKDTAYVLRSEVQVKAAMEEHNDLLDRAIEVGEASATNIVTTQIKKSAAECLAFILMHAGWPEQRVREKLALFQSGVSKTGENDPLFIAGSLLRSSRQARESKERLTGLKELGVVIYAMKASESGTVAIKPNTIKSAVQKSVPNPDYPDQHQQAAE
jgi:hypothetical protein